MRGVYLWWLPWKTTETHAVLLNVSKRLVLCAQASAVVPTAFPFSRWTRQFETDAFFTELFV